MLLDRLAHRPLEEILAGSLHCGEHIDAVDGVQCNLGAQKLLLEFVRIHSLAADNLDGSGAQRRREDDDEFGICDGEHLPVRVMHPREDAVERGRVIQELPQGL